MRNKICIFIFLLVSVLTASGAHSVKDIPNVHVADARRFVSNPDGILSQQGVAALDDLLKQVWDSTSVEAVVVAVDDIDSDDPDGFATDLFSEWGIGKADNDNGLLILVVRDKRRAVIRTGYGVEGVLPDVVLGRIIRNTMAPSFRAGDYDGGTILAVKAIQERLSDPDATAEVYSNGTSGEDETDFFSFYLSMAGVIGAGALILVLSTMIYIRKKPEVQQYRVLGDFKMPLLFVTFFALGFPVVAYLLLIWRMKRVRNRRRLCPNCGTRMDKLDEQTDNLYLTPSQDAEEKLDSVDYDVWLCPNCQETDILPYVNKNKNYTVCERCGARAMMPVAERIIVKPTSRREGQGVKSYVCKNCGNRHDKPFTIAKEPDLATAAAVGSVLGSMGSGRGGGGFSGGSFGGGMTGGGGASGGW